MQPKKKKLTGQQGELMRVLEITPDDLAANDSGVISPRQRDTLMSQNAYKWREWMISSGVMGIIALLSPVLLLATESERALLGVSVMSGLFGAIALILFGVVQYQKYQLKRDLATNTVKTIQGIAVVNVDDTTSQLEINGTVLHASPDVLRRVQHLQPYVVHYLPETKTILSMAYIPENDNLRDDDATKRLQDTTTDGEVVYYDDAVQHMDANAR